MQQKLKVVTIGGGSSYTPELLEGFLKRYHELPVSELWLVDVEEGQEKLNIIFELCKRMVEKAGVPLTVHKTLDRRLALKDADFVTTQLRRPAESPRTGRAHPTEPRLSGPGNQRRGRSV
jgi:6-phospho-beta-glucosidase